MLRSQDRRTDWPRKRLGDLVDARGITYGVVQPGSPVPDGVPIVRVNNFTPGGLALDDVLRIDPDISSRHQRSQLRGGEVLITLVGSTGQVALASEQLAGWNVARAVGVIPVVPEVPARWVAWCLQAPEARLFLDARLNTTVQKTLNLRDLSAVLIPLPSTTEIEAIQQILGTLEDKIDSNRRLAGLLDETAATLFRARFVDFVGVEEFEDGELGAIPRGWRVGSIYDVATVVYGRPFKSALFSAQDGVPLIRIRDLANGEPSVVTPELRHDVRLIRRGDVVVGMDGEFRAYAWSGPEAWLNQRVCVFDPAPLVSRVFLTEAIKPQLAFFEATKGGTTVIHLGKRDIDTFSVVVPPADVMAEFIATVDPLAALAVELRWESRILAEIRDALLPKLVSGELRVSDTSHPGDVIEPVVA